MNTYNTYFRQNILLIALLAIFALALIISVSANVTRADKTQVNAENDQFENALIMSGDSVATNADCATYLKSLPASEQYNQNYQYDTSFMPSTAPATLNQDINGDGLIDYVYHQSNASSSNPGITRYLSTSCVYLNNGNGWSKASVCLADAQVENSTGNYVSRSYKGDCAVY